MISKKSGFSLVELMVVVGIIGVLTTVAVPNYMRFQSKAKQVNAKSELSGIYGAEKAFYAEYDSYSNDLTLIGYIPDGIPLDSSGCPISSTYANWPVRFYATGYASAAATSTGATSTCAATNNYDGKVANTSAGAGYISAGNGLSSGQVSQNSFLAVANGVISGRTTSYDNWTITDTKILSNPVSGL